MKFSPFQHDSFVALERCERHSPTSQQRHLQLSIGNQNCPREATLHCSETVLDLWMNAELRIAPN